MNFQITALFAFLLMLNSSSLGQPPVSSTYMPVVHLTAEQDHQRIMDLLGMKTIRRGVEGNPASPVYANYDEAKANTYPELPDPLLLANGKRVRTPAVWWGTRRPQIVELFDREIYGRTPSRTPPVTWAVTATDHASVGQIAVNTRSLTGHVDNSFTHLSTLTSGWT